MSTITQPMTVDEYERMIEDGTLPENNRIELIEGRLVEKAVKKPAHPTATDRSKRAIEQLLPPGWDVRKENPVRIPERDSEPEPDPLRRPGRHRRLRGSASRTGGRCPDRRGCQVGARSRKP